MALKDVTALLLIHFETHGAIAMNEELDNLYKDIDDLLEEGLIDWAKKGVKKLQKAGKQLFEKISFRIWFY